MSDRTLEIAQAVGDAMRDARATVERLTLECERLGIENYRLRRELGKARLLADLRQDHADLERRATQSPHALLRLQGGE